MQDAVDLDKMAEMAGRIRLIGVLPDAEDAIAEMLETAAGELAALRGGAGTSGDDRRLYWLGVFAPLVWNCANDGTSHDDVADMIANMADAMLAAERAPKGGDHA